MKNRLPTELALLDEIFQSKLTEFSDFDDGRIGRSSKIWMPIDIDHLANKFDLDPDLIFGRLYYHLNEKYAHEAADGSKLEFFAIRVGSDKHCVNFPYLASILANLREEQQKFRIATGLASVSLAISIVSLFVASVV